MKIVNQQIDELENDIKNDNGTENKQLKYKFDKIKKLLLPMKFAENVMFSFCENSKLLYDRFNKCDQYFQELNNKISKNIEVEEHNNKCYKESITGDSSEIFEQLEFNNELESQMDMKRSLEKREDFDKIIEENQDEMDDCSDVDIEVCDSVRDEDSNVNFVVDMEENQNKVKEDSDVDIEGYDSESVIDEYSTLNIEGNQDKMEVNFEVNIEENHNEIEEEDTTADIIGFHDINVVGRRNNRRLS